MLRRSLQALLVLGALSCSAPFSEEEHSEGPPAGSVRFLITANYPLGSTADPDGFLAIGPGFSLPTTGISEEITSPGLPGGTQAVVRLGSVGDWCTLAPTQRTVTIIPGDTINAAFTINCGTLYRPTRIIYRKEGIRPDTAALQVSASGVHFLHPDDTLRVMMPVSINNVTVTLHPGCRRLPTDTLTFNVPYFPADTVNFVIRTNCGVVRTLTALSDGSPPRTMLELAGDSSYQVPLANGLPDAVRTRLRGTNIARARKRVTAGVTEWAITFSGLTTNDIQLRPWGTLFASYPVWRRNGTRVDFLVQDSTGVTIWAAQLIAGGGPPVQLSLPGTLALGSPDWSPDGTRLAYVVAGGIAIAAPGAVAPDQLLTPTTALTLTDPRWLPGGDSLVVVGALDTVGGARNAIWRMDIATGTMTQLTSPPAGESDGSVEVSSDGLHIVFLRRTIALGESDPAPRLRIRSLADGTEWQLPVAGTVQADPMWVP